VKGKRLEDSFQIVKAVRPDAEHAQVEVDLGVGRKDEIHVCRYCGALSGITDLR